MKRTLLLLWFLSGISFPVGAGESLVELNVDPGASSLGLTLDLGLDSGSQTQALSGSMVLAVDCLSPLSQASLRDFRFRATTNFQFSLVQGGFTAGTTNLEIYHAQPGPIQPYVAVEPPDRIAFSFVPFRLAGSSAYVASGLTCLILSGQGVDCRGVIALGDFPPSQIDTFSGTLSVSNGVFGFLGGFEFGPTPISGGATLAGHAVIRATGTLRPCLGIEAEGTAGEYRVFWNSASGSFHLDRAESLTAPPLWQRVEDARVTRSGPTNLTRWPREPGPAFYRLNSQ